MKLGKKTGAGTFVAVIAAALFAATIDAATYYVDPTGGEVSSDDYDGTAEVWQGAGTTNGPKRTLAAVMKIKGGLTSGDVVIALPGYYNDGVSNPSARDSGTALMRRVSIPSGVTLKSKCGPDVTFIIGEPSTAPNATADGLGTNAVACVSNSGTLQGFTLTGGRTLNGASNQSGVNYAGAGVYSGVAVNCIISNNVCSYRGGGASSTTLYYCRFYSGNKAPYGAASYSGYAYSCYYASGAIMNTTIRSSTLKAFPRGPCTVYNSIILAGGSSANNNPVFKRCLYVTTHADDTYDDGTKKISSSDVQVNANGVITKGLDLVLDKGNNDYCPSGWKTGSRFF